MSLIRLAVAAAAILFALSLAACRDARDQTGPYDSPYSDQDRLKYETHRRHVETDCNMTWSNCTTSCGEIRDMHHRSRCTADCDYARNRCLDRL